MRQLKITKQVTNRETASLDKYLQEIGKVDLITADEEVELAQKIKAGDQRALEKLTKANLRFVVSVSKQYQNQGLTLGDLINEGNLGLIKAGQQVQGRLCGCTWIQRLQQVQALTGQPELLIGQVQGSACLGQLPKQLEITAEGEIGQYDNRILTLSVLKGFFGSMSDEPVSYVNAPQLAKNAGLEIRETSSRDSRNFVNLITLRSEGHSISATLTGRNGEPRLVMIDDHATDVPPAENMLVVRNDDRPGVIGVVGTVLGNAGVNINDMGVGRSSVVGSALMVIASSGPAPAEVLAALRAAPGITSVHVLTA